MALALPPDATQWQLLPAATAGERLSPAAHWYFAAEWVALDPEQQPSPPIWVAAPQLLSQQQLQVDAMQVRGPQQNVATPIRLVPALASNPTFINTTTLRYLAKRSLRLRGDWQGEHFQVRTLWPEDWRISDTPWREDGDWRQIIVKGDVGAQRDFRCHELWRRAAAVAPSRWAIGFMLNGAQGDDDEAHGGHFALTIGPWREDGSVADWLVVNFYNPDVVSEKGILPALVPMDNYLADVNSGQQQYRPSWLVVCGLAEATFASALYRQFLRTLERLYDHRLHYSHTANNCTGLCMDALRAAGFQVPQQGPSSRWLAPLMFVSKWWRERNLIEARNAARYLLAEQTRLLPWCAFAGCVDHLLALLQQQRPPATEMEAVIAANATAVYGLHFPQLPSARAWGREPASSLFEYQRRVPAKREDWKIIPVPARPLPEHLRHPLVHANEAVR